MNNIYPTLSPATVPSEYDEPKEVALRHLQLDEEADIRSNEPPDSHYE